MQNPNASSFASQWNIGFRLGEVITEETRRVDGGTFRD